MQDTKQAAKHANVSSALAKAASHKPARPRNSMEMTGSETDSDTSPMIQRCAGCKNYKALIEQLEGVILQRDVQIGEYEQKFSEQAQLIDEFEELVTQYDKMDFSGVCKVCKKNTSKMATKGLQAGGEFKCVTCENSEGARIIETLRRDLAECHSCLSKQTTAVTRLTGRQISKNDVKLTRMGSGGSDSKTTMAGETGETGSERENNESMQRQIALLQTEIMNLQSQNKTLRAQIEAKPGVKIVQDVGKTVKTEQSTRMEGNTRITEINEYHFINAPGKKTATDPNQGDKNTLKTNELKIQKQSKSVTSKTETKNNEPLFKNYMTDDKGSMIVTKDDGGKRVKERRNTTDQKTTVEKVFEHTRQERTEMRRIRVLFRVKRSKSTGNQQMFNVAPAELDLADGEPHIASVPFSHVSHAECTKLISSDKYCDLFISEIVDLDHYTLGHFNGAKSRVQFETIAAQNINGIIVEDGDELLRNLYLVTLGNKESFLSKKNVSMISKHDNRDDMSDDPSDMDEFYYARFKPFKYQQSRQDQTLVQQTPDFTKRKVEVVKVEHNDEQVSQPITEIVETVTVVNTAVAQGERVKKSSPREDNIWGPSEELESVHTSRDGNTSATRVVKTTTIDLERKSNSNNKSGGLVAQKGGQNKGNTTKTVVTTVNETKTNRGQKQTVKNDDFSNAADKVAKPPQVIETFHTIEVSGSAKPPENQVWIIDDTSSIEATPPHEAITVTHNRYVNATDESMISLPDDDSKTYQQIQKDIKGSDWFTQVPKTNQSQPIVEESTFEEMVQSTTPMSYIVHDEESVETSVMEPSVQELHVEQPVRPQVETLLGLMIDTPRMAIRQVDVRIEKKAALKWIEEQMRLHDTEEGKLEIRRKLQKAIEARQTFVTDQIAEENRQLEAQLLLDQLTDLYLSGRSKQLGLDRDEIAQFKSQIHEWFEAFNKSRMATLKSLKLEVVHLKSELQRQNQTTQDQIHMNDQQLDHIHENRETIEESDTVKQTLDEIEKAEGLLDEARQREQNSMERTIQLRENFNKIKDNYKSEFSGLRQKLEQEQGVNSDLIDQQLKLDKQVTDANRNNITMKKQRIEMNLRHSFIKGQKDQADRRIQLLKDKKMLLSADLSNVKTKLNPNQFLDDAFKASKRDGEKLLAQLNDKESELKRLQDANAKARFHGLEEQLNKVELELRNAEKSRKTAQQTMADQVYDATFQLGSQDYFQCDPELVKSFQDSAAELKRRFDLHIQLKKKRDDLMIRRLRKTSADGFGVQYRLQSDWLDKLLKNDDNALTKREFDGLNETIAKRRAQLDLIDVDQLKSARADQDNERGRLERQLKKLQNRDGTLEKQFLKLEGNAKEIHNLLNQINSLISRIGDTRNALDRKEHQIAFLRDKITEQKEAKSQKSSSAKRMHKSLEKSFSNEHVEPEINFTEALDSVQADAKSPSTNRADPVELFPEVFLQETTRSPMTKASFVDETPQAFIQKQTIEVQHKEPDHFEQLPVIMQSDNTFSEDQEVRLDLVDSPIELAEESLTEIKLADKNHLNQVSRETPGSRVIKFKSRLMRNAGTGTDGTDTDLMLFSPDRPNEELENEFEAGKIVETKKRTIHTQTEKPKVVVEKVEVKVPAPKPIPKPQEQVRKAKTPEPKEEVKEKPKPSLAVRLQQALKGLMCKVPLKNLGNGYFMFGTRKIYVKEQNGMLVVRVGGGYIVLNEFIDKYQESELRRMEIESNKRSTHDSMSQNSFVSAGSAGSGSSGSKKATSVDQRLAGGMTKALSNKMLEKYMKSGALKDFRKQSSIEPIKTKTVLQINQSPEIPHFKAPAEQDDSFEVIQNEDNLEAVTTQSMFQTQKVGSRNLFESSRDTSGLETNTVESKVEIRKVPVQNKTTTIQKLTTVTRHTVHDSDQDSDEETQSELIEQETMAVERLATPEMAAEASNQATRMMGTIIITKEDDQVDKKMKTIRQKLNENAMQVLRIAFMKQELVKREQWNYSTKGQRQERQVMDQLVEQGEIQTENAFLTHVPLERFDRTMFGLCPVVKLAPGQYMIGTEKKSLIEKNNQFIVRVGGGYVPLEQHINNVARVECLKIWHLMRTSNLTYTEAVIHFLRDLQATEKVIENYRNGNRFDIHAYQDTMKVFEKKSEFRDQRRLDKQGISQQIDGITKKVANDKLLRQSRSTEPQRLKDLIVEETKTVTKVCKENQSSKTLEQRVETMFQDQNCKVPLKILGNGYFMFGSRKIFAKELNGQVMVRVGGGYITITEFIEKYQESELRKMEASKITDVKKEGSIVSTGSRGSFVDETGKVKKLAQGRQYFLERKGLIKRKSPEPEEQQNEVIEAVTINLIKETSENDHSFEMLDHENENASEQLVSSKMTSTIQPGSKNLFSSEIRQPTPRKDSSANSRRATEWFKEHIRSKNQDDDLTTSQQITNKNDTLQLKIDKTPPQRTLSNRSARALEFFKEQSAKNSAVKKTPFERQIEKEQTETAEVPEQRLVSELNKTGFTIPPEKISKNKFRVGQKIIKVREQDGDLVIRTGGGFMKINSFVATYGNEPDTATAAFSLGKQESEDLNQPRKIILEMHTDEKISGTKRRRSFTQQQYEQMQESGIVKDYRKEERAQQESLIEYPSESKELHTYLQEDIQQEYPEESKEAIQFEQFETPLFEEAHNHEVKAVQSEELEDSEEAETIRLIETELEQLASVEDDDLKVEAEAQANRVLGLPDIVEIQSDDDEIDKKFKTYLGEKMEQGSMALKLAYLRYIFYQLNGRQFKSKGEKEKRLLMDQMIRSGEVNQQNAFITDMWLRYFDRTLFGLCPVVKMEPGKYLIGTETKQILERNGLPIVRVGGGFEPLESHINNICRAECFKIWHLMRTMNLDFMQAMIHFLDQVGASEKVKENFRKSGRDGNAFDDMMKIFEKKAAYHQQREQQKKPHRAGSKFFSQVDENGKRSPITKLVYKLSSSKAASKQTILARDHSHDSQTKSAQRSMLAEGSQNVKKLASNSKLRQSRSADERQEAATVEETKVTTLRFNPQDQSSLRSFKQTHTIETKLSTKPSRNDAKNDKLNSSEKFKQSNQSKSNQSAVQKMKSTQSDMLETENFLNEVIADEESVTESRKTLQRNQSPEIDEALIDLDEDRSDLSSDDSLGVREPQDESYLANFDDAQMRLDAEREADRILGLPARSELTAGDTTEADKQIKLNLRKNVLPAKTALIQSWIRYKLYKIKGREWTAVLKQEKEAREKMDKFVADGEVRAENAFMTDMWLSQFDKTMYGMLPVVKLDPSQYMIGTEKKEVKWSKGQLLVKVGQKYKPFNNYLASVCRAQSLKIWELMRSRNLNFVEAVCHFLSQNKATSKVIEGFRNGPQIDVDAFLDHMKTYDMKALGRETKTDKKKVAQRTLNFIKDGSKDAKQKREYQSKSPVREEQLPSLPAFKFQAGIDEATDVKVLKQVHAIIASKVQFTDPDFPAVPDSIGSSKFGKVEWRRIGQIYKNAKLFKANDRLFTEGEPTIKQGAMQDGSFAVVMNKLEKPDVLLYNKEINSSGIYAVFFYINGISKVVVVDDQIPCLGGKPLFAHSENEDAWVLIVEKAWAKLRGSYARTELFRPHYVYNHSIGIPSYQLQHHGEDSNLEKLKFLIKDGLAKQYTIYASKDPECELQTMHDVNVDGNTVTLVKLRGSSSKYKGAWTFNSKRWTSQLRKLMIYHEESQHTFVMELSEYFTHFHATSFCLQIDSSMHHSVFAYSLKTMAFFQFTTKKAIPMSRFAVSVFQQGQRLQRYKLTDSKNKFEPSNFIVALVGQAGTYIGGKSSNEFNFSLTSHDMTTEDLVPGTYTVFVYANWHACATPDSLFRDIVLDVYAAEPVNIDLVDPTVGLRHLVSAHRDLAVQSDNRDYYAAEIEELSKVFRVVEVSSLSNKRMGFVYTKNESQHPLVETLRIVLIGGTYLYPHQNAGEECEFDLSLEPGQDHLVLFVQTDESFEFRHQFELKWLKIEEVSTPAKLTHMSMVQATEPDDVEDNVSEELLDSDDEGNVQAIEAERKYLDEVANAAEKQEANDAAHRVLGKIEFDKDDDALDKQVKQFLQRKAEDGKQALAQAYLRNRVAKRVKWNFASKGQKLERKAMDGLLEKGEIQPQNEFLTDVWLEHFDRTMFGLCPIVKLDKGMFMIGTEKKQIIEKNNQLIVRVGGGYEPLESHIRFICRMECLKILYLMRKQNINYVDAVCQFLKECKASDKVIDGYRNGKNIDILAFQDHMKIYEKKAEFREQRRKDKQSINNQANNVQRKLLVERASERRLQVDSARTSADKLRKSKSADPLLQKPKEEPVEESKTLRPLGTAAKKEQDPFAAKVVDVFEKEKCRVPVKSLGNGYFMFGTRKIYAKEQNGMLVVRIGGGYMVITEFIKTQQDGELKKMEIEQLKADKKSDDGAKIQINTNSKLAGGQSKTLKTVNQALMDKMLKNGAIKDFRKKQ